LCFRQRVDNTASFSRDVTILLDSCTRNPYIVLNELVSAAPAPTARHKKEPFMKKKAKKDEKKAPKKAK
jgi:hypothetical protein